MATTVAFGSHFIVVGPLIARICHCMWLCVLFAARSGNSGARISSLVVLIELRGIDRAAWY